MKKRKMNKPNQQATKRTNERTEKEESKHRTTKKCRATDVICASVMLSVSLNVCMSRWRARRYTSIACWRMVLAMAMEVFGSSLAYEEKTKKNMKKNNRSERRNSCVLSFKLYLTPTKCRCWFTSILCVEISFWFSSWNINQSIEEDRNSMWYTLYHKTSIEQHLNLTTIRRVRAHFYFYSVKSSKKNTE